ARTRISPRQAEVGEKQVKSTTGVFNLQLNTPILRIGSTLMELGCSHGYPPLRFMIRKEQLF
ncbi:MAG: hypothetical protein ACP5TH_05670, partial [Fervidicoccaceae archaeon]